MSIPVDIQPDELSKCLFSESNDAFLVIDPARLQIITVNPAAQRISGFSRAELAGRSIDDVLVGEDANSIRELTDGCRKTAFIHSLDGYQLRCKEGMKDVNISLSRLHGELRTWSLIVLRDVTDRKELERSLKQSNERYRQALTELKTSRETIVLQEQMRAVSLLASGVAHDLNNLLSPIVTLSGLLIANPAIDATARGHLEVIERSALGAAESVRRLSRYQAAEKSSSGPVSLDQLLTDVSEVVRLRLRSHQQINGTSIRFSVSIDGDLPGVCGTEAALHQVLLNLVFNAVDAVGEGGQVVVSARACNDGVEVEVADDGVGMTSETTARSLDPFFTTKPEGAGIGLTICQGTIDGFGGRLEVESEPGQGSKFRFWLPVDSGQIYEDARDDDFGLVQGISVLCVDDDDAVRGSLVELLAAMGVSVDQASDGGTAISMSRTGGYDAVITDLWMEGVSGWDVIQAIRQDSSDVPICVLSGWEQSEIIKQAPAGLRPDRILTKPVVLGQLFEFLSQAASDRKQKS